MLEGATRSRGRRRRGCTGGGGVARSRAGEGGAYALDLRHFLKKLKIFWKARNTRKVSAGYMIRVTFARAQNRRKTGALFVAGQC